MYSPSELVYGRAPVVFPAHARALFEERAVDFKSPEGMSELMTVRAERVAIMVPTAMHNVEQDALDPRVRPGVYKVYEVNGNGADGDTARVRVEEMARCAVPYVNGFTGSTAEALQPRGTTVIDNDFNPIYQTEMCETPPNGVLVTKPGQPRALPTILARPDSYAYSSEGADMLFNITSGECKRPTAHMKEELFGYDPNVIHGIPLPDHERLIGNAMGLHSVAWIVGQRYLLQERLRDLEELARAAWAAPAAQGAEWES
eukprot:jgi/Tetstr1/446304/TSEL_033848.t1